MKMEQTECSETLAYKIQTPGNYLEENIQHTEHGESLKSRNCYLFFETSAYKIQTPGNYPEENIQHSEQGESLKSRKPKISSSQVFNSSSHSDWTTAGHHMHM